MHVGRPNIGDRVAKSGLPQILERQGSLRVELAEILGLHTLYTFSANTRRVLLGAEVFTRRGGEKLEILDIAARHNESCGDGAREQSIALLLVEELCRVARRVKGIRDVSLAHDRGTVSMCNLEKNAVAQPLP